MAEDPVDPVKARHVCAMAAIKADQPPPVPPEPAEYPPLMEQAGNLLGSLAAVVKAVARGEAVRVDPAEYDRRMAICQGCEHMDKAANRCRKCACYLAVKPWLKAEHCPVEKW